jgi:diguanylate cyclase (GGDEF)-like protein/PAS domain S-box-containing protein
MLVPKQKRFGRPPEAHVNARRLPHRPRRTFIGADELATLRAKAALVEAASDAIIGKSLTGVVLSWNQGAERLYGYRADEAIGRPVAQLFGKTGTGQPVDQLIARVAAGETLHRVEFDRTCRNGSTVRVSQTMSPVLDACGQVVGVSVVARDITAQTRAERQLTRERAFMRQVLDTVPSLVYVKDANGRFLIANRAVAQTLGLLVEQVEGRRLADLLPHASDAQPYDADDRHVLSSSVTLVHDEALLDPDGRTRWFHTVKTPLVDGSGEDAVVSALVLGVSTDITERKALEQRMHELAHYDPVTGLPRRPLLEDRIASAIALARRSGHGVGVLFCDLDQFKQVNDTLGHAAGDLLLRAVGERARAALRESDTVARVGGDEFVILLSEVTGSIDARQVSSKLLKALSEPYLIDGRSVSVTPSLGLAMFPHDGEDASTLILRADAAMYHAKANGRANLQCFTPGHLQTTAAGHELVAAIEHALAHGELRLHFQPQIDLRAGEVRVIEALLRWQHPQRGLLLPSQFLHAAEDHGMSDHMGDWVLNEACRQAANWARRGQSPTRVSVNLSAAQCSRTGLIGRIERALEGSGLDPHWLEIEVTENLLMRSGECAGELLQSLRALGVTVAIDDFGTGYSNLPYLTRLPIDRLKIDGAFIHGAPHTRAGATMLSGIIQMAHALNLTAVAEGVETAEQMALLRAQGCDDAQGYLICPPLNAESIGDWLASHPRSAAGRA